MCHEYGYKVGHVPGIWLHCESCARNMGIRWVVYQEYLRKMRQVTGICIQDAVAQWLRESNIFRQICKSTSEWRGFESRWFYQSGFEFAKTPLLILNHYRCGSISCPLVL